MGVYRTARRGQLVRFLCSWGFLHDVQRNNAENTTTTSPSVCSSVTRYHKLRCFSDLHGILHRNFVYNA